MNGKGEAAKRGCTQGNKTLHRNFETNFWRLKDEGTATVKKARIAFWLVFTASLLFTEQLTATGSSSLH